MGQEHVIQTLRNALLAGHTGHAYLFAGPRGTGKTTTARLLAKAVNCLSADAAAKPCGQCDHCTAVNAGRFLDLIEIDAASNTSVEDVRDLRDKINFSPNQGRYKVYIIDEVHMLSTAAFNALLKTLEEPPAHAIFILATTEVHKIPATVLSRCQRHEFRRIPVAGIVAYLRKLADEEHIQVEPEALTLVARQSTGAMRDAVSLLDQLASTGQVIDLAMAQNVLGTAANQAVLNLVNALLNGEAGAGLDGLHQALDSGSDPRQFARQVVDYLRDLLLVRMGNAGQVDALPETRAIMARHAQAFSVSELLRVIRIFNDAATESRSGWQPALPLELAFIEALEKPGAQVAPAGEPAVARTAAAAPAPTAAPLSAGAEAPAGRAAPRQAAAPAIPQSQPPAEEPEELAPEDAGLAQRVNDSWREILNTVRKRSPQTYGYLNSTRGRSLRQGVLILGFPSPLLQAQMEKSEHLTLVQEALQQVLGQEITVRCTVITGRRNQLPPHVDADGMVAAALNDLGGEIVDVQ